MSIHLCILSYIVWSISDGVFQTKKKPNSRDYPRIFVCEREIFWISCKVDSARALKSPCKIIISCRAADAPGAGPLSGGQMTGNLQGDKNTLEPRLQQSGANPFPVSLLCFAALFEITERHWRRAPRCVLVYFIGFAARWSACAAQTRMFQDLLLTSLLLCWYSGRVSCIFPQLQTNQTYLNVLIDQPLRHLIMRRCSCENRMIGRTLWGISAGFTFTSVSNIYHYVIVDVIYI